MNDGSPALISHWRVSLTYNVNLSEIIIQNFSSFGVYARNFLRWSRNHYN